MENTTQIFKFSNPQIRISGQFCILNSSFPVFMVLFLLVSGYEIYIWNPFVHDDHLRVAGRRALFGD